MRIAMWSGPRNLSTAMMYSFGARSDFAVLDEPFYAAYLNLTGLNHPMRNKIVASQPTKPEKVVQSLLGPVPNDMPHFYQKHMSQHMIKGIPRAWAEQVKNIFLIRHPARVLASFSAKYEQPTLADIGFLQQAELFDQLMAQGLEPIVIESSDIRRDPEGMLRRLCDAIDLPWDPSMLRWPAGGHPDDGVWAAHWYGAVHRSTGFAAAEGELPRVARESEALIDGAMPAYRKLEAAKL